MDGFAMFFLDFPENREQNILRITNLFYVPEYVLESPSMPDYYLLLRGVCISYDAKIPGLLLISFLLPWSELYEVFDHIADHIVL